MKKVGIFLMSVLAFGLIIGLLHNRLPDPVTWGLGLFVMLLIWFPIRKGIGISKESTFAWWTVESLIMGLICTAVGFLITRVL